MDALTIYGLKQDYPKLQRVELIRSDDPDAPEQGTQGFVRYVDERGTVHIRWDNGRMFGIEFGRGQLRLCK